MTALVGFEACRAKFDELLGRAAQIRSRNDAEAANELADDLASFQNDSRPNDAQDAAEVKAISQLDALASKVENEMTALAIGKAVGDVVDHQTELARISQGLDTQTLANTARAKRIRLTPVRDLIDRLTDLVAASAVAAKSLDTASPDEAKIQQEIASLSRSFAALVVAAQAAIGPVAGR